MLRKWKLVVVTALFIVGAVCFFLGLFPSFAPLFWGLWIAGCSACIFGLILAVVVPSNRPGTVSRP
ncbi:hypothetical protein [Brevibacterium sp. ZH18]|uniref:hypothetical protein n=1 Tax=Brevibacterium sp. ZH18 TaxID=2927784 RepID=UPI001F60F494|nr:hypothetical protein [Brevibacterium sp. ZH18]MCI4011778.1 hypothetical protein [Brevibacterium sp. ZH18]